MGKSTAARIGIAGAVAGVGLAAGGVALASAETESPDATSSSKAAPAGPRGDRAETAKVLAEQLDLDQSKVQTALDAVRKDLRPDKAGATKGSKPTAPTEAERSERQSKLAAALAEKLGVSEAKVKAALAVVEKQEEANREKGQAQSRADLVTRLDAAVKAGTLTEADKTSVLKAYDANLLGGGRGGNPGGGRGGPSSPAESDTGS